TEIDGPVLREPHLDAAVLRNSPLGNVEPSHDLQAGRDLHRDRYGRLRDLREHAVLTKPYPVKLLVRLEVNVRSPTLDGVEHYLVDETYARCVVHVSVRVLAAGLVIAARNLEVLEIEVVFLEARHRRVYSFDRASNPYLELVLLDDNRLDPKSRLELDLVQRMQVRRIADRDIEALASLQNRQHSMLRQQLVVDQANDIEIRLDRVEVE